MFAGRLPGPAPRRTPDNRATAATGGNPDNPAATKALTEAQAAFVAADKALSTGDLAAYQAKIKEAQAAVQRAVRALGR